MIYKKSCSQQNKKIIVLLVDRSKTIILGLKLFIFTHYLLRNVDGKVTTIDVIRLPGPYTEKRFKEPLLKTL